ncbi:TPA: hypothetical protein HA278_07550 [Candidatus Woesearchaeota archaeon]|nr:hypothetical protein [archaeon]HIJ11885.1 hypothetical protein [Candidatus Woesearchaeota archaeon]|tara:strand:+ start:232 stop:435 length:204 start_codon:yes stop_codon:yes gene_type:complete
MTEVVNIESLHEELKALREDITFIKEHMFDPDCIMTDEEYKEHLEAVQECKEGKGISFEDATKELGL